MKVEKAVGWIKGQNGTGVIYELSSNGGYALANIWQDGKFHYLSIDDAKAHIEIGKAQVNSARSSYQAESALPKNSDGSLKVDNPDGWDRLYTEPVNSGDQEQDQEIVISDNLEFPVSVKFEGVVKINIAGLSKILNLL